jgi:hypothetical protein
MWTEQHAKSAYKTISDSSAPGIGGVILWLTLNILEGAKPPVKLAMFAVERLEFLMGFAFRGKPVGQGMLPLRKMLEALAASSRQANVIVEQWPPFRKPYPKR